VDYVGITNKTIYYSSITKYDFIKQILGRSMGEELPYSLIPWSSWKEVMQIDELL